MNETKSAPAPVPLQKPQSRPGLLERESTVSTGDPWIIGSANLRSVLVNQDQLWNGEGQRCEAYWPVLHLESQYRCELIAGHATAHFRSSDSI
jgi:hypothetical protein